jgi:hypothetical protein
MDIPSLFMIPSAVSSGKVHSVFPNSTDADFDFARSSTATRVNSNGLIESVASGQARLNYEIEGGLVNTKPSLLLEPQSTNLATYSQDFSQWSTISASATDDYATSPEGITNASRFLTTSTGAYLYLSSIGVSNSTVYTISVYAKSNGNNLDDFRIYTSLGDSSTLTATSEWQRFTYTFTTSVTSINIGFRPSSTQNADIQVFGYQLEQQSYPTSYIPTNGSSQTRAAETCNGAGTSSILPSEEGILYVEMAALESSSTTRAVSISDGSNANAVSLNFWKSGANDKILNFVGSGGVSQCNFFADANVFNFNKIAMRFKANNFEMYINGVSVGTDTSGSAPIGINTLRLDRGDGASKFYGKIRGIRVYNTKEMTDSEVDILLTKITS